MSGFWGRMHNIIKKSRPDQAGGNDTALKQVQHDLNNQLNTVNYLLQKGLWDEAEKFLAQMEELADEVLSR